MGTDRRKDQSYVLYSLGQAELRHTLFPLGPYTKPEVRDLARHDGLPVADREESMELCFVSDDDYRRFLRERAPQALRPGPILDTAGREIGRHQGLAAYTVGQRRGLRIAAPEPLYVIRLDMEANAVIVGPAHELGRRTLLASDVRYVKGEPPPGPVRVQAKIRYKANLADATWTPLDNRPGQRRVRLSSSGTSPPARPSSPTRATPSWVEASSMGKDKEISIRQATAEDYDALCTIIDEVDTLHRDRMPHIFQKPPGPVRDRGVHPRLARRRQRRPVRRRGGGAGRRLCPRPGPRHTSLAGPRAPSPGLR